MCVCVSSATSVYVHTCTILHVFSHYKQTPGPHVDTFMREDRALATDMMSEILPNISAMFDTDKLRPVVFCPIPPTLAHPLALIVFGLSSLPVRNQECHFVKRKHRGS